MADTQKTARVQANLCNLSHETKRYDVVLVTGIVYALAVLLVVLRIGGKVVSKRLSLDDWIVACAVLLSAIPVGCVLAMTSLGFGDHLWNLEDGRLLPILRYCTTLLYLDSARTNITAVLIASSTYVIVLGLIKVSLILFYLEIFNTSRFRITAFIILGYIAISSLVICLLTIFSCTPVRAFWNRDVKGKCLNVQALAYANSASAIIQDIILLILPLVFIRNLQMKRYKKVAVGFMFSIGTFGCIATIVRLHALLRFKLSIDPTWDYAPAVIWTVLELAAGFACVSLPSIRILLVRLLPASVKKLLSSVGQSSRSRNNRTPQQNPAEGQRHWHKRPSWVAQSQELHDSGHGSGANDSFISRIWSGHSSLTSTHRHVRTGSRRLNSAMSNYSESNVAVTHPPYKESRWDRNDKLTKNIDDVVLLRVPKKKNESNQRSTTSSRSRDSQLTALPPIKKIGLLPERSFSDLNLSRDFRGRDRKQKGNDA